ncbi:3-ketoacyl-ACP reductase [Ectopseudomonas composti]|uniref:3-ketoacyl-ACP reductase n=1 Tax=Ectopseudomonas composti TaxID=658457 RepID=A0ABN0S5C4_9GAMM|nr:SDR family oxidoreductase [Pseudomonas composti]EZH76340.1 3-ketoacyl-ACP reductase [Pseudomonas composti]
MSNVQKVAIVTGASRGIGAALAKRLAGDGMAVVINYSSSASEAEALAADIHEQGGNAIALRADVAKAQEVRQLFEETERRLGKVDVLVNNAGIFKALPVAETDDALFERTIAVNLAGVFNTLREASTRLNDGGRIINFSTSVLGLNLPGYALYGASKAAVETLTRVFAKEMRGRNVTVNAVAPGPVATELFLSGKSEEQIENFARMPPLERLGQPEDIAAVVSFLAGPDAAWINGQVLRANGGLV